MSAQPDNRFHGLVIVGLNELAYEAARLFKDRLGRRATVICGERQTDGCLEFGSVASKDTLIIDEIKKYADVFVHKTLDIGFLKELGVIVYC